MEGTNSIGYSHHEQLRFVGITISKLKNRVFLEYMLAIVFPIDALDGKYFLPESRKMYVNKDRIPIVYQ